MRKKTKFGLALVLQILLVFLLDGCYGEYFGPGVSDYNYKMSGGYQLFKNGAQDTTMTIDICDFSGQEVIGNHIMGIAWDDRFILASQKDRNTTNYWIIDAEAKRIVGPLSKSEFNEKKRSLNVDSKLTLQDPAKYKNLDSSPLLRSNHHSVNFM